MAYKKNKTADKIKNFTLFLNGVKVVRIGFFFYAFLAFVFWFLQCLDFTELSALEAIFGLAKSLVRVFYYPSMNDVNFTYTIIGGISLCLGFAGECTVNILYSAIADLEEEQERLKYRAEQRRLKKLTTAESKTASNANMQTENTTENITNNLENSKLLFLIHPLTNKIKRKKEDLELTFQEVEIWKQRINKKLIESVKYSDPIQKGYYRKNLFLMYKDFFYVDDFLYYVKPTLDSLILEFRRYGIAVSFCHVLSALSRIENLEKELDCMDTILSLNFLNDFIVTNRFKITYDNKPVKKYSARFKGEYNLSKNLSITNRQSLFSLTDIRKGEQNENENHSNGTQ